MPLEPFVIEGELLLSIQEGGFASDMFGISPEYDGYHFPLEDLVASHFGVKATPPDYDRLIGRVRITIERIDEDAA